MGSASERNSLLEACRLLPPAEGPVGEPDFDYAMQLMWSVLDKQMNETALSRMRSHIESGIGGRLITLSDLGAFLAQYSDDTPGNTAAAIELWGYKYSRRLEQLRGLVEFFDGIGVRDIEDLRSWAERSNFTQDFEGQVPGLAFAVYQWLIMRLGVETIKPDSRIRRFVTKHVGRKLADAEIVSLLESIAAELGISALELDLAIWQAES